MRFRMLLSLAVIIGIMTPVCTGGIFTLTAALGTGVAVQEEVPMTKAPPQYLTCGEPADEETDDVRSDLSGGCSNAEACLSKTAAQTKDRLAIGGAPSDVSIANGQALHVAAPGIPTARSDPDPPPIPALLAAHIVIRRE